MSDIPAERHATAGPPAGDTSRPRPTVGTARRFRTPRTIGALILREMQTTYGRSPGGYAWALLEPIGGIALMTLIIVSGFKIREPALGTNFPLFLASGILVLTIFGSISNRVAGTINFSRPLLRYPGVTYTDAIIARILLNLLTQLLVFYIIIVGIHALFDVSTIFTFPPIFTAIALTTLLGTGIGVLNCFLFSIYPLWENIWKILTRPLFLVSTVFYTFEQIPSQYQDIGWWNPLVHPIGLMRRGFYAGYEADWASPLYVSIVGAVTLLLGLLFLHRFHKDILNR